MTWLGRVRRAGQTLNFKTDREGLNRHSPCPNRIKGLRRTEASGTFKSQSPVVPNRNAWLFTAEYALGTPVSEQLMVLVHVPERLELLGRVHQMPRLCVLRVFDNGKQRSKGYVHFEPADSFPFFADTSLQSLDHRSVIIEIQLAPDVVLVQGIGKGRPSACHLQHSSKVRCRNHRSPWNIEEPLKGRYGFLQ